MQYISLVLSYSVCMPLLHQPQKTKTTIMTVLWIINQVVAKENEKILCVCGLCLSFLRSYNQQKKPFALRFAWLQREVPVRLRPWLPREQSWGRESLVGTRRDSMWISCKADHLYVRWTCLPSGILLQGALYDLVLDGLKEVGVRGMVNSFSLPLIGQMPFHGRWMPLSCWATRLDWGLIYWRSRTRGNESQ